MATDPVIFPVGVRWQDGLPLNIVHWASARSYVAASGRVFSISMTESENLVTDPHNHQAKQQWLTARSAASGLPLWKLPLGTEDPKSDLNTLNALPLATDGAVVLVVKDKALVAVNAADGEILRTFPVAFPTSRLVFVNGIAVAAGWETVGRKAMWDSASKPDSSLWDVRFGGTGQGAVEAFEAATAKALWKDPVAAQQVLATDDTVVYLTQGAYPVKEQAVVARALKNGRTPLADDACGPGRRSGPVPDVPGSRLGGARPSQDRFGGGGRGLPTDRGPLAERRKETLGSAERRRPHGAGGR